MSIGVIRMKQIKVSELKEAYDNNTLDETAEIVGVSRSTLLRLLKESGIKRKGKGNRDAKGGSRSITLIHDLEDLGHEG